MGKKVLIVTVKFSPQTGIGRLRPLKFAKHLFKFGWESVILTVKIDKFLPIDICLLKEIPPHLKIYRTPLPKVIDPFLQITKNFILRMKQSAHRIDHKENNLSKKKHLLKVNSPSQLSIINFVKKLSYKYFLIPDDWILWVPGAYFKAIHILKKEHISAVFTTAPPLSTFLVGYFLKTKYGIPWICDYRDLWTGDVLREWVPYPRKIFEKWLERKIVSNADAVISVSEKKVEFLKQFHSSLPKNKFHYIPNGYDEDEYQYLRKYRRSASKKLKIVYTGRLFKNRNPYLIIEALYKIKKENPSLLNNVIFEFYGYIESIQRNKITQLINKYSLQKYFKFIECIPYEESKKKQIQADILLLIVDTGKTSEGVLPGKLFEYIAAQRPILGIMPKGDASNIIENGKLGWWVESHDLQGFCQTLKKIIQLHKNNQLNFSPNLAFIQKFDRVKLTEKLAQILDTLI